MFFGEKKTENMFNNEKIENNFLLLRIKIIQIISFSYFNYFKK